MQKVLSDYDGIMIETEFSKALGWYIAGMSLQKNTGITEELVEKIITQPQLAKPELEAIIKDKAEDLKIVKSFAGGTTQDFALRTWQFCFGKDNVDPSAAELEFINGPLTTQRSRVRDNLIELFAEPISENLQFFKKLHEALRAEYGHEHPLGLVNQSYSAGLHKQLTLEREGKTIWREFPELRNIYGNYTSEAGYEYAECAGDKGPDYAGVPSDQVKTIAYKRLLKKMNVAADATISFEDTRDGVFAAKQAGIICFGVKLEGSNQDFSGADYVIEGNLEELSSLIPYIVRLSPQDFLKLVYSRES